MTDNPQTPQGQQGDHAAVQRTGGTDSAPTERIPETPASPETPYTSPTGSQSPAEQQLPQAPGIAPQTEAGSGAAFGPAATAQQPTAQYPSAQYGQDDASTAAYGTAPA